MIYRILRFLFGERPTCDELPELSSLCWHEVGSDAYLMRVVRVTARPSHEHGCYALVEWEPVPPSEYPKPYPSLPVRLWIAFKEWRARRSAR